MKNCKDIENSLPLYAENLLSADEKNAVEEHLKSCAACAKALAQLQRSGMLMQKLKDVEPPPWFKQKIMTKVREKAEKENFARKWFYPLRIKIPVQIAATVVIAVLTVYIYRFGDEQMKAILPETPQVVVESQQLPPPAVISKDKEDVPAPMVEKKAAAIKAPKQDKISEEVSVGGSEQKMEIPENKLVSASDKSPTMKSDLDAEKKEKKYTEHPAQLEAPQRYSARQASKREESSEDSSSSGAAKKSMMFKAAAPAASVAMPSQARIFLHVVNVNSAVAEVEKILTKHVVRKFTKQLFGDKTILKAEFPAKNIKEVLAQLRGLGRVEEKNISTTDSADQNISMIIEIISN